MALKLGILGSGKGSNFVSIAEAIQKGTLDAEVVLVGSDFADALILSHAAKFGFATYACPPSQFKTKLEPEIETQLAHELKKAGTELLVLAGFMRVLKRPLLDTFAGKIINIHPSLLPAFPGLKAWEQAWKAQVPETGCTVHLVNDQIDAGRILGQIKVPVQADDTPETLHARIQKAEHTLFPQVLQDITTGKIRI